MSIQKDLLNPGYRYQMRHLIAGKKGGNGYRTATCGEQREIRQHPGYRVVANDPDGPFGLLLCENRVELIESCSQFHKTQIADGAVTERQAITSGQRKRQTHAASANCCWRVPMLT